MKYFFGLLPALLARTTGKRNVRIVVYFVLFTTFLIALFSILFHHIMELEGREYSFITGLYWTLTVMSTLGFGDITFSSDAGKLFSIVVLLSGIVLFMLIMPFTFIRFVYQPWIDNYANRRRPRELPPETAGHTIIVGDDDIALGMAEKLHQYHFPYTLLVQDSVRAVDLHDSGYFVVTGELDDPETYRNLRTERATLVVALSDDLKNTNIASTVRQVTTGTMLAASASNADAVNILLLAGCDQAYSFTQMLGRSLARRVRGTKAQTNIVARYGTLCIAEAPVLHTDFTGKTLRECGLRERFGLNVAGLWEGNLYKPAHPDSFIDASSVFLLAGTSQQLKLYDRAVRQTEKEHSAPVLILGGGKVGFAAAHALEQQGIPFYLVEKNARLLPESPNYIIGNAEDIDVLRQAHLMEASSIIVTSHNDDLNIYLTIFCRKLRPDVQILSRATLDRNVDSLYNAGANLVLSYATLASATIVNLLSPGRVTILTEGLNIFQVKVPPSLVGLSLRDSRIRELTECNVVAVHSEEKLSVPPDPLLPIPNQAELILIGTEEAEHAFMTTFPEKMG